MATLEELWQRTLARRKSTTVSPVLDQERGARRQDRGQRLHRTTVSPVLDQERERLISELKRLTDSLRNLFLTMRGIPPSSTVAASLDGCREFRHVLDAMLVKARKRQVGVRKPNEPQQAARANNQKTTSSSLEEFRWHLFTQLIRSRDRFQRALEFMTGFPISSNLTEGLDACREVEKILKKIEKGQKSGRLNANGHEIEMPPSGPPLTTGGFHN